MINIILILTIITFSLTYLLYIYFKFGIQRSISASYNNLKPGITKSFYSLFIFFVAWPMAIVADNTLGWIACGLLMIDYVFPAGDGSSKEISFFHVMGAQGGMGFGVAMLGFNFHQWWLVVLTAIVCLATYILKKKEIKIGKWQMVNETWWIEVEVLVAVVFGLIIEKL